MLFWYLWRNHDPGGVAAGVATKFPGHYGMSNHWCPGKTVQRFELLIYQALAKVMIQGAHVLHGLPNTGCDPSGVGNATHRSTPFGLYAVTPMGSSLYARGFMTPEGSQHVEQGWDDGFTTPEGVAAGVRSTFPDTT